MYLKKCENRSENMDCTLTGLSVYIYNVYLFI